MNGGKLRGSEAISHGGGINGFSTFAIRMPKEKVFVAMLANSDSGTAWPNLVARKVAAVAIGNPYPEHKEIALGHAGLDTFAGSYKMDDGTSRTVRREGERLTMQRGSRGRQMLYAYAQDRFFIEESTDTLTFGRDAAGRVDRVTQHRDDGDVVNLRTGDAPSPQP